MKTLGKQGKIPNRSDWVLDMDERKPQTYSQVHITTGDLEQYCIVRGTPYDGKYIMQEKDTFFCSRLRTFLQRHVYEGKVSLASFVDSMQRLNWSRTFLICLIHH